MTIDLCVVSYNCRPLLERLVRRLCDDVDHTNRPWRLYIQDNGSSDDSISWLKTHEDRFDGVAYAENVGYAKACNHLATLGTSPIIGLLNADVWMSTSDIWQILYAYTDPSINILGPKQRNEAGRITHAGIFGSNEQPKHRGWQEYDLADQLYRDQLEAVTVSGSAYFVRRDCWNALTACPIYRELHPDAEGAFLPTKHYFDETFASYHAHSHGMSVRYDGTISIGHTWHASSAVGSDVDLNWTAAQTMFRVACDKHGILHD